MTRLRGGVDAVLQRWRRLASEIVGITDKISIGKPVLRGPRHEIVVGPLKLSQPEKWMRPDLGEEFSHLGKGHPATGPDDLSEEVSDSNAEK